MVVDAIRMNRSDAALVRITSPLLGPESDPSVAEDRARAFAQELFPYLDQYLPS